MIRAASFRKQVKLGLSLGSSCSSAQPVSALLKECNEKGIASEAMIRNEMKHNHVRHDALDLLKVTPTLDERPLFAA